MDHPFYNQSWFWTGIFTLTGTLGAIFLKEWIASRTQTKIERIKMYESDLFSAYRKLYEFISSAHTWLWPPNEPARDFLKLMKHYYFEDVKKNILFFSPEIRQILGKLEHHYDCLTDSDFIPKKPFDEFYDKDLLGLLRNLGAEVKNRTDKILHEE